MMKLKVLNISMFHLHSLVPLKKNYTAFFWQRAEMRNNKIQNKTELIWEI